MRVARRHGMHGSSWMLQQLDYATRGHHLTADAMRMSLLGAGACRERYLDYLARTFAFEAPVETRWQLTPGLDRVVDVQRRLRTGFLASDLRALGFVAEGLAPAPFCGVEQALGWMYVIERGRRMNGMLHRHLLRRMPRELAIAGNYLAASSPIGTRWQQLGITLDQVAHNHAIAEQIINAAQRAFRALRLTLPVTQAAHAA